MFTNSPRCQYDKPGDIFALGLIIWSILQRKPKRGLEVPTDGAEPIGYSWLKNHSREWRPLTLKPGDGLLHVLAVHMATFDPNDRPSVQMVKDVVAVHHESSGRAASGGDSSERLVEAYERMSKMCDR